MTQIVDGLIYLGASHFGYELALDDALNGMDAVGTDIAIAAPMHTTGADFAVANDSVLWAADASGGRIIPLARVDPWLGAAAIRELERAIAGGAQGLYLNPSEEHFRINDVAVRPLIEAAAEAEIPITVAAGFHLFSEPLQLGAAAKWVPNTPFILTNGGQFNISGLAQFDAELALTNPNVYVQTSAMYREDYLEGVVRTFGDDRLIFASAAPKFEMTYERKRVDLAHFSSEAKQQILGGTTARLYSISSSD
jgi:predicted TIM-barrel fold metal-dependent hydrolase